MQIKLEGDRIVGYATVGGIDGGIEAPAGALDGCDKAMLDRGCGRWNGAAAVVDEALALEAALRDVRQQRDALLAKSDWTQMPDAPMADDLRQRWRTYRQALRDLPETITDPMVPVEWPVAPE